MTETEATPRPWHWTKSQASRILRGPDDLYIGSISYVPGNDARDANVELIVEAVNSHDTLVTRVAQLEQVLRQIAAQRLTNELSVGVWISGDFEYAYDTMIGVARAALTQAEKE
jgi:acetolactate synthase regulatory subunit